MGEFARKKWKPPTSKNKEGTSSWGSELGLDTAAALGGVADLPPGDPGAGFSYPTRDQAQGLEPAGAGGELRLECLHEAGASKVSEGCIFIESVAWKKILPPTQGDNMDLCVNSG